MLKRPRVQPAHAHQLAYPYVRGHAARPSSGTCVCHADSEEDSRRAPTGDDAAEDSAWALPNLGGGDADWRDFRAQLVARSRETDSGAARSATAEGAALWAHEVPGPEQGCVLLANPLLFKTTQTYFRRGVILITDHSEGYSRGIVMNKAIGKTLAEAEDLQLQGSGFECFAQCPLNLGGDLQHEGLVMLHPHGVGNARRLRRGIYEGGGDAVAKHVASGAAAPTSVRWFYRYAGWGPGQLAHEVTQQRSWYCVSCSPELLMAEASPDDPDAMWHGVMQLLDDDHRRVSDQVRADTRFE